MEGGVILAGALFHRTDTGYLMCSSRVLSTSCGSLNPPRNLSRKMPHTTGQLSQPSPRTLEPPAANEPALHNQRRHCSEKALRCN